MTTDKVVTLIAAVTSLIAAVTSLLMAARTGRTVQAHLRAHALNERASVPRRPQQ